jgi:hypothetical protein
MRTSSSSLILSGDGSAVADASAWASVIETMKNKGTTPGQRGDYGQLRGYRTDIPPIIRGDLRRRHRGARPSANLFLGA